MCESCRSPAGILSFEAEPDVVHRPIDAQICDSVLFEDMAGRDPVSRNPISGGARTVGCVAYQITYLYHDNDHVPDKIIFRN